MPRLSPARLKLPAVALAGLFVVTACLSDPAPAEEPTATPGATPGATLEAALEATPGATEPAIAVEQDTPAPTPVATPRQTTDDTLVVIAPAHPTRLLPGRQPQRHRRAARGRPL